MPESSKEAFEQLFAELPPVLQAKLEQMQEQINAQADLIAWLLLDLQRQQGLSENHFPDALRRFSKSFPARPEYAEHAALAENVVRMLAALRQP
ncbi:MAG TPA: hypothetical protein VL178_07040 [Pseudomonas sp.]|nr:hypothetical protein [Pseudomonas sp.]